MNAKPGSAIISPETTHLESPSSEATPRRPFAVWLLFLMLVATTLVMVLGMLRLYSIVTHLGEVRNPQGLTTLIAWRVCLTAVAVFATVSIYRRGFWGRWLGVAAIAALALYSILQFDSSQYGDESRRQGAITARIFAIPLLCAWWAYAFAFSSKAKQYFSRRA